MKKKFLGGLALCLLLAGCGSSGEDNKKEEGKKVFTVGIIQAAEHPALSSAKDGLKQYFEKKDDIEVKFVEKNAQGDVGTMDIIAKQFVSDKVDLIYSIGTNASQAAVSATMDNGIPVIFNAVTDPSGEAKLIKSNENPGANVTGVSDAAPLEKQVGMIREFLPEAKTIGMIYNIGEPNGKIQVEQVEKLASKFNFTIVKKGISATTDVATATEQLLGKVDCIYNITDNMVVSATASITDKANAKKIPVFAAEDGQIKMGLLASDSISYTNLGEQAGNMAYEILVNGKKPADMPVQIATDTKLYINKKVADELGIKIPDALAKRATFVEE